MLKMNFRPLLLQKMLRCPRNKDTPLADTVKEVMKMTSTEGIPNRGLRILKEDSENIKR